jgi:acyl-CoA thioesterase FadM
VTVDFRRPLGRGDAPFAVSCTLDAVGRASFRTRETIAAAGGAVAVEAATTLEAPGRALTAAEREALAG